MKGAQIKKRPHFVPQAQPLRFPLAYTDLGTFAHGLKSTKFDIRTFPPDALQR